jgi:hypothetical protein
MSSEISEIEKEGIDNAEYSMKYQNRMFTWQKKKETLRSWRFDAIGLLPSLPNNRVPYFPHSIQFQMLPVAFF